MNEVDLEKHIQDLENEVENPDRFKMKLIDKEFTYIFNEASRHVIGPKPLPPTETKIKLRSNVLYWKARIRLNDGKDVDVKKMKRRIKDGDIKDTHVATKDDMINRLRHAQAKWKRYVDDKKERYQEWLLDFIPEDMEEETDVEKKTKIASSIERAKKRNNDFRYITEYVGKGKKPLKKST